MNAMKLQDLHYMGYAREARVTGHACAVYRPVDPLSPLAGDPVATLPACFNVGGSYKKPNSYGAALWQAVLDGRLTRPGDVLVRQSDGAVWFIAAQQHLLPIMAIACNSTVAITRPVSTAGAVGAMSYGASVAATDQVVAAGWPASLLLIGKGATNRVGLPDDVLEVNFTALLPPSLDCDLQESDMLTDTDQRRYIVQAVEHTALGWRLLVKRAQT